MATLIPPKKLVKLKRQPLPPANWGYKWHMIEPDKRRLTVCGIILVASMGLHRWHVANLEDVPAKDICKKCLGGMTAKE